MVGGTVAGYLLLSALAYVYHRTRTRSRCSWEATDEIHHSPQRVDISGLALFDPIEMVVQVLMELSVTVIVLGLDPVAAPHRLRGGVLRHVPALGTSGRPRWIGVLIQRPEAHCEHHRKGVHAHNYGDLPVLDILLDTFRNPAALRRRLRIRGAADRRLLAMLAPQVVNRPAYGAGSAGFRSAG